MSKFLKLTSTILNTNYIHKILIIPNKYYIYCINHNINGLTIFGNGVISSNEIEIEVCATNHNLDYKIVSEFINKL